MMFNIPSDLLQLIKYVIAGCWNTLFGIGLYTGVILLFGEDHYLILGFLCNIIAITQSFFCYKLFVFKSKGNILKEYLKIYVTYGASMLFGLVAMYILVDYIHISAIYANIIVTGLTLVINFFMHKNFTFRQKNKTSDDNLKVTK